MSVMQLEIEVATNFLLSFAYSTVARQQADSFKRELARTLSNLYCGHWYPENPSRGSAFRSLQVFDRVDPSIQAAADASGIDSGKLRDHLPKNLTLWIDPSEVSYRLGEKGDITTLWREQPSSSPPTRADSRKQTPKSSSKSNSRPGKLYKQQHVQSEWSSLQDWRRQSTSPVRVPGRSLAHPWSGVSRESDLSRSSLSSSFGQLSTVSTDSGLADLADSPCSPFPGSASSSFSEDDDELSPVRHHHNGEFFRFGSEVLNRTMPSPAFESFSPPVDYSFDLTFDPIDTMVVS